MATIQQIQQAVQQAIDAFEMLLNSTGSPTEFSLRSGEVFTIPVVRRKKRIEEMTDGIQQKDFDIQFLHKHWTVYAAREPEKGDQLTMAGRRHAIEKCFPVICYDITVGYVARVLG